MTTLVRSALIVDAIDESGDDVDNAVITITKKDGTVFAQSVYAAESGGSSEVTHTGNTLGRYVGYAPQGERVKISINGNTPVLADITPDPYQVVVQGMDRPVYLDGYALDTEWGLTVKGGRRGFRAQNADGDDLLRVGRTSTGTNLIQMNTLDSSEPTTSLIYAAEAITTTGRAVQRITADVTAVVTAYGIDTDLTKSVAGAGNITAGAFRVTRSSPASAGVTRAVYASVASQVAGSGLINVGVEVEAINHPGGSSQAADIGFYFHGAAGATYPILAVAPNGSTILFSVTASGIGFSPFLQASNGSAAAPSYVFTGSTTDGMFLVAAGTLGFSAAGAQQMTLSATAMTTKAITPAASVTYAIGASNALYSATYSSFFVVGDGTYAAPSLVFNLDTDTGFYRVGTNSFGATTAGTSRSLWDATGNFVHGAAAIATNATDGFLYIPTCAGAPTGVPTAYTGRAALVYDTTNAKWWAYSGSWKGVVLA